MLTLTFFKNSHGIAVGDLYHNERRLIATTHPATVVAALFAMGKKQLAVTTSAGSYTGNLEFFGENDDVPPLVMTKMRYDLNPRFYQFKRLASSETESAYLEGLDLFSQDSWFAPHPRADQHLRLAQTHLPADVIVRPLTTPSPKGWWRTVKAQNEFIYFPNC